MIFVNFCLINEIKRLNESVLSVDWRGFSPRRTPRREETELRGVRIQEGEENQGPHPRLQTLTPNPNAMPPLDPKYKGLRSRVETTGTIFWRFHIYFTYSANVNGNFSRVRL